MYARMGVSSLGTYQKPFKKKKKRLLRRITLEMEV